MRPTLSSSADTVLKKNGSCVEVNEKVRWTDNNVMDHQI